MIGIAGKNRAISLPIQKLNMVIRANPARDLPVTLEDASYLRLRSLTLGYTLPWKIQYVDNIRLSFSGENLFVLSGFSGVDPELPAEVGK